MHSSKHTSHYLHQLEQHQLTGNCLIAELYRLSFTAPVDFANPNGSQFVKLLIDFSYFESRTAFDNFTEQTEEGRQLDEKFFSTFSPFLKNFAQFLDKLNQFIQDIVDFSTDFPHFREQFARLKRLEELELQCAQVLYLLGLLLLLVDFKFAGAVRERIFVALYRLRVDFDSKKLQTLVDLLRNRKEAYETCFTGFGIDDNFLNQIFTFLRFYKGPRHGWLENALYVCLYFEPGHDMLNSQFSVMRQIIDNFFADRWILHFHVDFQVNLYKKWDRFKAASAALASANDLGHAHRLATDHLAALRAMPLPSGLLSLEAFEEYEKLMVDLNGRLRWLIMHFSTDEFTGRNKKAYNSLPSKDAMQKELFTALKQLAHFEYKFGQACAHLRNNREESVNKLKQRICDNFAQILAFLRNSPAGTGTSSRRTERLINWLESLRNNIDELTISISTNSNNQESTQNVQILQKLDQIRAKIADMLQHQLQPQQDGMDQQQMILRQSLQMARADLQRLQNVCAINGDAQEELMKKTDSTYLFRFVDDHCAQMEELLREDALSVKFIFLKIANSIPNLIHGTFPEDKRKKLASFYYKILELRLRAVIQAIPRAIFEEMAKLNQHFSTADSHSVSIEKSRIKEFVDLPRRRQLSELTYRICKLSLGIANTCLKQLGDVQIQPRALLCDGLRNELSKRLMTILTSTDSSTQTTGGSAIFKALHVQQVQLEQFRKAFLFVCDHVGIRDGVQIWAEQLRVTAITILASKFNKITAKPAIGPSTSISPTSPPEMVILRFFDFAILATKPSACSYNPMDFTWRAAGADGQTVKFTSTAFACFDSWMLFGLGTLTGLILHQQAQELAKTLEKSVNLKEFPTFSNPTKLRQFLKISGAQHFAIDGQNRELLQKSARLGQLRLLLASLEAFMRGQAHSQLGVVYTARQTFLRSIQSSSNNSNSLSTPHQSERLQQIVAAEPTEMGNFLPKLVRLKSAKSQFFLLHTMLYFSLFGSTTLSTKKRGNPAEFLDPFAVIAGAQFLLKDSAIWGRNFMQMFRLEKANNQRYSLAHFI